MKIDIKLYCDNVLRLVCVVLFLEVIFFFNWVMFKFECLIILFVFIIRLCIDFLICFFFRLSFVLVLMYCLNIWYKNVGLFLVIVVIWCKWFFDILIIELNVLIKLLILFLDLGLKLFEKLMLVIECLICVFVFGIILVIGFWYFNCCLI